MIALKNGRFFFLISVLLISYAANVPVAQARMIETEGSAPITNGAIGKARVFAVQDAVRQALVQNAAQVTTTSLMSSNAMVVDSTKVRAAGRIKHVVVLDEWTEEDVLHVLIRAELPDNFSEPIDSSGDYRKKVGVTQFYVMDRTHIHDLPNIEIKLPRRLLNLLEESGGTIGFDATQYLPYLDGHAIVSTTNVVDRDTITRLAESIGVQFVMTGIIKDLGTTHDFFGGTRRLVLELQLYDGLTGVLIARHTNSDSVIDGSGISPGISLNSPEFLATELGKAIDVILRKQIQAIKTDLGQLPLSARVIRNNGKRIYIDAGATSLIRAGDVLMAYKLDSEPVVKIASGASYGYPETPVATLTIKQVQPLFAVGELETDQVNLNPGDVVRFGW